jgi:Protein of unknown function (DUF3891)
MRTMLIRDDGDSWLAIPQPAHALLSGQVARAWGNARFAAPDPYEAVCLGAEQHDVAWAAWDLRPPLNAEARRAASFLEAPFGERLAIWDGAPERVLAQDPFAALLVSLHGRNVHTLYVNADFLEPAQSDAVRAYLARQDALQERLIAGLGIAREHAEGAAALVLCVDALSLRLCHGWPAGELPAVDGTVITFTPVDEDHATLDPWPLAVERLQVGLSARRMTARFDDEAALHDALDAAPWTTLRWTLTAA